MPFDEQQMQQMQSQSGGQFIPTSKQRTPSRSVHGLHIHMLGISQPNPDPIQSKTN
jgi:Cu/Zn superoxide dismutase